MSPMNVLNSLASVLHPNQEAADPTADEALEAKKARIQFHRDHVRNGPAKFSPPTSGQVRRAEKRAMDRKLKNAHRKQVRAYFAARREGATLRGHLDSVGVLTALLDLPPRALNPHSAYVSTVWLIRHFADQSQADERGAVQVSEELVRDSFRSALNRWQQIVGMPASDLPEGYELPVATS